MSTMNFEEFVQSLAEHQGRSKAHKRTPEIMRADIFQFFAASKIMSGSHYNAPSAFMKLVNEYRDNPQLKKALDDIIMLLQFLFPDEVEAMAPGMRTIQEASELN